DCLCPRTCLGKYAAGQDDVHAMRASPELRTVLAELRLRARRHLTRLAAMSADIPEKIWQAFVSLASLRPWVNARERTDYQPFQPPELPAWRAQWRIWWAAKSL